MTYVLPALWRYFLGQYIKVFSLSLFAFLVILLTTRLEDLVHFITLGATLATLLRFVCYQIPYVMQIALPISSLIATLYLFQRLAQNNTITAMRASGLSFLQLATPVILASCLIASVTFSYILDLSAKAHEAASSLEKELGSSNPIALLHNSKMLEEKGMSLEMKGVLQKNSPASNFIMALRNGENGRIALLIAKKMHLLDDHLKGSSLSFISTFTPAVTKEATTAETPTDSAFDHLIIENSKENIITLYDLAQLVNKKKERLHAADLPFTLLLAQKNELTPLYHEKKIAHESSKRLKTLLGHCYSEMARRISLALSIVTFTLLGIAYGSSIGRRQSRKRMLIATGLAALYITCYLGGKAVDAYALSSTLLYMCPHIVLIAASLWRLARLELGFET